MARNSIYRKVRTYRKENDGIDEVRVYIGRKLEFIAYDVYDCFKVRICRGGYAGYWLNEDPKTESDMLTACKEFYNEHSWYQAV